jgi:hypothetical protein
MNASTIVLAAVATQSFAAGRSGAGAFGLPRLDAVRGCRRLPALLGQRAASNPRATTKAPEPAASTHLPLRERRSRQSAPSSS